MPCLSGSRQRPPGHRPPRAAGLPGRPIFPGARTLFSTVRPDGGTQGFYRAAFPAGQEIIDRPVRLVPAVEKKILPAGRTTQIVAEKQILLQGMHMGVRDTNLLMLKERIEFPGAGENRS